MKSLILAEFRINVLHNPDSLRVCIMFRQHGRLRGVYNGIKLLEWFQLQSGYLWVKINDHLVENVAVCELLMQSME